MKLRTMSGWLGFLLIAAAAAAEPDPDPDPDPISEGDLVLFMNSEAAAPGQVDEFGETPVDILNNASDGRQVVTVDLKPGWTFKLPATRLRSMELIVLNGELLWKDTVLRVNDYAFLPASAPAPRLAAGLNGASALIFLDPYSDTDGEKEKILHTGQMEWRPGVVAQRDTGLALKLEVLDLLWVESTGQRTWLLRAGPDLTVPWEIHQGVEEGYLLEGDYRMGECLPGDNEPITGNYEPGGYFYRPGGIVHSGPESGSKSGALWLLRTPTRLTVDFVDGCSKKPLKAIVDKPD
ncbi:MAG TPA: hypothetical protein VKN35_04825 [Xanthomonadales bacterium]|nr:hypothetical protein [Xanthomonadales bacterium]